MAAKPGDLPDPGSDRGHRCPGGILGHGPALARLAWLAFLTALACRDWRWLREGDVVGVVAEGLYLRHGGQESQLITWSDISRAARTATRSAVVFLIRECEARAMPDVFRAAVTVEDFVDRVNRRVAASRQSVDSP